MSVSLRGKYTNRGDENLMPKRTSYEIVSQKYTHVCLYCILINKLTVLLCHIFDNCRRIM